MPTLALHRDFLHDFGELPAKVRARVEEALREFEHATHTGLHLERIARARHPRLRSIRIDGGWRGILLAPERGDTYLLLKVLPHDDAYTWAARHDITVNAASGKLEIRDDVALRAAMPALDEVASRTPERLFAHIGDKDLRRLGIDDTTLAAARAMTGLRQLDAARGHLPTTQWDALFGLAAGLTVEQVWSEIGADLVTEPVDPTDLDTAITRSPGHVLFVNGPAELMRVFADPFALWRIYLHPVQQGVVDAYYRGPARVAGGPGTGKTVVVLHRCRRLAERGGGRILLTTFTTTLADSLQDGVTALVDDAALATRITVRHVDRFAYAVFHEKHGRPRILDHAAEAELWRRAQLLHPGEFTETFLAEEWRHVVLAQQISDREGYRAAGRDGRGRRLGRLQKGRVWDLIEAFEALLISENAWTWEILRREATRILENTDDKPFRHIVVDEAQDLSPDQWRLLRAAVPVGSDDIFIAGDTQQRIYDNRVSLRDCGIDIAGRSRRLTVNYRTTAEILAWSMGLLRGEAVDDMNGGLENATGCRSEVHGAAPESTGFRTRVEEFAGIAGTVCDWVAAGVRPEEIGIAVRVGKRGGAIADHLTAAGIPTRLLTRKARATQEVSVATMHRMKGLEFRCVIVADLGEEQMPLPAALTSEDDDPHAHDRDVQRERCLLFVACTRAREQLLLTWHGKPSRFIDPAMNS